MKNIFLNFLLSLIILTMIIAVLNVDVTTKQGVNYRVREIKLPLYLKLLDFIDRHYNYKNLVASIIGNTKKDSGKAIKILNWVNANVRRNPEELPIIDDHPLNILIRGYGVNDQFEDIFTILCSYAGMDSFFKVFKNHSGNDYCISFVKLDGRWCPLSAYEGIFLIKNGDVVSVDDILLDERLLGPFISGLPNFSKDGFLKEINTMSFDTWSVRTSSQNPLARGLYCVKNMFHSPGKGK